MFSLERFYDIISKNLLEPMVTNGHYFEPFGSTDPRHLIFTDLNFAIIQPQSNLYFDHLDEWDLLRRYVLFYDQEPIYRAQFDLLFECNRQKEHSRSNFFLNEFWTEHTCGSHYFKTKFYVLANSEHSTEKNNVLKTYGLIDWYYFFHGFAALDWYRNIRYLPPLKTFSKVFISFNNLFEEKRSYRLTLISMLIQRNLNQFGYISMSQQDIAKKIKKELYSKYSLLSKESKYLIYKTLLPNPPSLVIDTDSITGTLSANDNLHTLSLGLFHLVTETVFYDEKLHLTEKIFKPIIAQRPFLLVAAPGNLAYLKSYGFKTFDRWIDESYDLETDHDRRLSKIVDELDKLCKLSQSELQHMYQRMQETLEYNFNWFYNDFRKLITNELVDNFEALIKKTNAGKDSSFKNYLDASKLDFDSIKKTLLL